MLVGMPAALLADCTAGDACSSDCSCNCDDASAASAAAACALAVDVADDDSPVRGARQKQQRDAE
jgi:hypothetical protein